MKPLCQRPTCRLFLLPLILLLPATTMAATPTQLEVQKLVLGRGAAPLAHFGSSVAVHGDTAVVGAPLEWRRGPAGGAAYVFRRGSSGVWMREAKLLAGDGAASDYFGISVAVDGTTVVIGASHDDDAGDASGSAYVFVRDSGGSWSEKAKLLASDGDAGAIFGRSVAISGDTAVVGAPYAGQNGSAYVFQRSAAGSWREQAKLVASDGGVGDSFGDAVAISGDTAVIGAYEDDDYGDSSGSAYVYTRDANATWTERAKLIPADAAYGDRFGVAVAISGATALIGAGTDDDNGFDSGSAYVFVRDAGGFWLEQAKLLASDGGASDALGHAVSVRGDVAVVGAAWHDGAGQASGAAYLYRRDTSGSWSEQAKLVGSDAASLDGFGTSVAMSGDVILVGAHGSDEAQLDSGAAYLFSLTRPTNVAALHCPGDLNGDGTADLVLVRGNGRVQVQDLSGVEINGFELATAVVVDSEIAPDWDTSGAPELVALSRSHAEVRDLMTGGHLGTVDFAIRPTDLELTGDLTGNGSFELAVVEDDPIRAEVRDGLNKVRISEANFARYAVGVDLAIYPDLNSNGAPELAVLADNRRTDRADKIEIRDAATGKLVHDIWLGKHWRVREQELIADLDGSGTPEVAVLRVHPDGRVNVQIRDIKTRAWVNFVGFAVQYPPTAMVAIPDINGNGADELVVVGQHVDGSRQKAVVKDSRTGVKLGQAWFDPEFPGQDLVDCGDINGNGANDLALLGLRLSDGTLQAMVKDGRTGESLAVVRF